MLIGYSKTTKSLVFHNKSVRVYVPLVDLKEITIVQIQLAMLTNNQ